MISGLREHTHKKKADKKIYRTELSHFKNYFYADSSLQEVFFIFLFFLRKHWWRNNVSNQILESFQEQKYRETTAVAVTWTFQSGIQIITQNLFKLAVHNNDKKSLPFCFLGLHSGRQGSVTKGVAKRHGSGHPCLVLSSLLPLALATAFPPWRSILSVLSDSPCSPEQTQTPTCK